MQSSPSPTSIIRSINQSNYLCSQTPDPTPQSPNQHTYKDQSNVFQRLIKNIQEPGQPQFKQVVIVQQTQNTDNASETSNCTTRPSENTVSDQQDIVYKSRSIHLPSEGKQESYEYKNYNIDHISGYDNQDMYHSQQINQNELYRQDIIKINTYDYNKSKYYLPNYAETNVLESSENPTFVTPSTNHQSNMNYNRECKNKSKSNKSSDAVFLHPLSVVSDRMYSGGKRPTQTSNECEYSSSGDNNQK